MNNRSKSNGAKRSDMAQRARARLEYLQALQTMTRYGGRATTEVMLRDSDTALAADELKAVTADSSRCVVAGLKTPLGSVPAAVLRAEDLVSVSVHVLNDRTREEQQPAGTDTSGEPKGNQSSLEPQSSQNQPL